VEEAARPNFHFYFSHSLLAKKSKYAPLTEEVALLGVCADLIFWPLARFHPSSCFFCKYMLASINEVALAFYGVDGRILVAVGQILAESGKATLLPAVTSDETGIKFLEG
jgi:hypothetical protein